MPAKTLISEQRENKVNTIFILLFLILAQPAHLETNTC